ncbi:MAG: ParB N-terminal domain-containing protein [bacterium]|nr:ParB N-terminal domain-containing protein [bacterium]
MAIVETRTEETTPLVTGRALNWEGGLPGIDYSIWSREDLLRHAIEIGGKIKRFQEQIPIADIFMEDAVVDTKHANDMAKSMKGEWGQLSDIAVRARSAEGTDQIIFEIIDGFHRTQAKKDDGEETIRGTVAYNCTDGEFWDLRIIAANSVKQVQIARLADWVKKAWALTPWAAKGLSSTQAFTSTANKSKASRLEGISIKDIQAAHIWIEEKCGKWQRTPFYIGRILRLAEDADPELVRRIRTAEGLKDHKGRITLDRLAAVAAVFPVQTHRAAQLAVMNFVVDTRLYAEEIACFATRIAYVITPDMSEDEILELLRKIRPEDLTQLIKEDIREVEPEEELVEEEELMEPEEFAPNGHESATLTPQAVQPAPSVREELLQIDDESELPPANSSKSPSQFKPSSSTSYNLPPPAAEQEALYNKMQKEILSLRAALRAVREGQGIVDLSLLVSTAAISGPEALLLQNLETAQDLEEACRRTGITPSKALLLFQSAIKRNATLKPEEVNLVENVPPEEQSEDNSTDLW